jgi:hypothetical protein
MLLRLLFFIHLLILILFLLNRGNPHKNSLRLYVKLLTSHFILVVSHLIEQIDTML